MSDYLTHQLIDRLIIRLYDCVTNRLVVRMNRMQADELAREEKFCVHGEGVAVYTLRFSKNISTGKIKAGSVSKV